jgi:hypothetical protein
MPSNRDKYAMESDSGSDGRVRAFPRSTATPPPRTTFSSNGKDTACLQLFTITNKNHANLTLASSLASSPS